jgi:hypothetical protein
LPWPSIRSVLLPHLNLKLTGCCVPPLSFATSSMQVSAQAFSGFTLCVYRPTVASYLDARCGLSTRNLSRRCPRTKVGLPPDPEGKGTDSSCFDVDTFLTALYVMVDDFRQSHRTVRGRPGRDTSLCHCEVITLSIFARWSRFTSERDFYRYAEANLRGAFSTLPDRSQFNRLARSHARAIEEIAVKLGEMLEGKARPSRGPT